VPPKFWYWLIWGSGGRPGLLRLINRWLILHALVGMALSILVPIPLGEAADSVLTPLVGLLIGLAFAWAANAQALLQSEEMEQITKHNLGGFPDYVYSYQLSVLVVLSSLILWGFAGLGIYDRVWPKVDSSYYVGVQYLLYFMASLTLRTCWHVVLGAQFMLLARWAIRDKKGKSESKKREQA
jgi:hypothetical protein